MYINLKYCRIIYNKQIILMQNFFENQWHLHLTCIREILVISIKFAIQKWIWDIDIAVTYYIDVTKNINNQFFDAKLYIVIEYDSKHLIYSLCIQRETITHNNDDNIVMNSAIFNYQYIMNATIVSWPVKYKKIQYLSILCVNIAQHFVCINFTKLIFHYWHLYLYLLECHRFRIS